MLLAESSNQHSIKQMVPRLRVLVLCTGNSARSIMAEAIFNTLGADLFQAFSAGSHPTGKVHPMALEQISQLVLPKTMIVRSKSWDEFIGPNAVEFDLLLSICDNAAAEVCPAFVGQCEHIHWGFPDPAGSSDDLDEEREAFARCFSNIKTRLEALISRLSTGSNTSNNNHASVAKAMRELS